MRASLLGLTVLLSIGAVCATYASESGGPRDIVGTGVDSSPQPREIAPTAQVPPRSIYSCQSTFAIPFTVDLAEKNSQEVLLFMSMDYGRTWRLHGRQPAVQGRFVFRATNDGDYWFASRTTAPGMPAPAGVSFKPELSVIVDTTDPRLDLQAKVESSGEIRIAWDASDQHLAPETLKLEYQSGLATPWRPIPVRLAKDGVTRTGIRGETRWEPDKSDKIVSIRAVVQDKAENAGEMTRRLIIPLTLATRGRDQNTMTASNVPSDPFAQYGLAPDAPQEYQPRPDRSEMLRENENDATREKHTLEEKDNGYPTSGRLPEEKSIGWPSDNEQDAASEWQHDYPPSKSSVGPRVARRVPGGRDTSMETSTDGSGIRDESMGSETGGRVRLPQGERPHMTRSRRFNLDYSIDAVGPLGVEKVELWVTRNGGRHWDLWGVDEDRESPFLVSVEDQGTYGFRIVIVGRNGLASQTPRPGDSADLWVGVDTTKPTADVTSATYGSGAFAGHLDVRWTVTDDHLGAAPITLLISEKRNGPWTPIASGLQNTGQHHWRVDSRVPDRFYLRLEVRDEAGNLTTRELDTPIRSAGLTPKGHVRGIEPFNRQ